MSICKGEFVMMGMECVSCEKENGLREVRVLKGGGIIVSLNLAELLN